MAARAFDPSTRREAEGGRSLNSMLAWSTERVLGQPGLHREALSWKKNEEEEDVGDGDGCSCRGLGFASQTHMVDTHP